MKKYLVFFFTTIFLAGLFLSCENFLENGNFTSLLESDIAYAKSKSYDIRMECENGSGSFLNGMLFTKKESDVFNVEFKLNAEWNFSGWKAYSVNSNGQYTELSSEYIDFSEETIIREDTRRVTVTFNKSAENIVIKAESFITPKIISHTPQNSAERQFANTPVTVTFNTRMNRSSLSFSDGSISIKNKTEDISRLFLAPELDESGTVLTIIPDTEKLLQYMNQSEYIDVAFNFGKSIVSERQGRELSVSEGDSTFSVKYKNLTETEPPAALAFFATAKEISIDGRTGVLPSDVNDAEKFYLADKFDSRSGLDEEKDGDNVYHNRTGYFVYLYGLFEDSQSKISRVTVTELHTHYRTGLYANGSPRTTIYDRNSEYILFNGNSAEFCIPHRIISGDGAVFLTVTVWDSSKNYCSKELTVISYTSISDFTVYNNPLLCSGEEGVFDMDKYMENCKTLRIANNSPLFFGEGSENQNKIEYIYSEIFSFNGGNTYSTETGNFTIEAQYRDRNGNYVTQPFSEAGGTDAYYYHILDVDSLDGLSVNITATDSRGVQAYRNIKFPSGGTMFYVTENTDTITVSPLPQNSQGKPALLVLWEEEEDGSTVTKYRAVTDENNTFAKGPSYSIIGGLCRNQNSSLMTISGDIMALSYSAEPAEPVRIADVQIKKHPYAANLINAIVTIDQSEWEKFDSIYIPYTNYEDRVLYLQKGMTQFTLELYAYKLFSEGEQIKVYGIKNGILSEPSIHTIPKLTGPEFDIIPPEISLEIKDYDTIYVSATDLGSGVKSVWLVSPDGMEIPLEPGPSGFENMEISSILLWENLHVTKVTENSWYKLFVFKIEDWAVKNEAQSGENEVQTGNISIEKIDSNPYITWPETIVNFSMGKSEPDSTGRYTIWPSDEGGNLLYYKVSSFDAVNGHWNEVSVDTTGDKVIYNVPENTFAKVLRRFGGIAGIENGDPQFFYAGALCNSGEYDYIQPSAYNENMILVTSDAPVLMHTIATNVDYETASKWSAREWELHHYLIDEKQINFTSENPTPKKYMIPVGNIDPGMCYVVVAHFANGTAELSNVRVK